MGPMSGQGLRAGGTPGGLHRKRFPLGRDVLLARPAPGLRRVPLAGLYPWIPFQSLSQLGISSFKGQPDNERRGFPEQSAGGLSPMGASGEKNLLKAPIFLPAAVIVLPSN